MEEAWGSFAQRYCYYSLSGFIIVGPHHYLGNHLGSLYYFLWNIFCLLRCFICPVVCLYSLGKIKPCSNPNLGVGWGSFISFLEQDVFLALENIFQLILKTYFWLFETKYTFVDKYTYFSHIYIYFYRFNCMYFQNTEDIHFELQLVFLQAAFKFKSL